MKMSGFVRAVLIFFAGMLLGGVVTFVWSTEGGKQPKVRRKQAKPKTWPPQELHSPSGWSYVKVGKRGWSTGLVGSFQDLDARLRRPPKPGEILIPIFPTVYAPRMEDKIYYDAILQSGISPGDKVLVIGTGSGADSWVASLKSKSLVYVVEINPLAVANARTTARLAGFQIKPMVGSIVEVKLPPDFREFDYVLWNMPYVWKKSKTRRKSYTTESISYHDGDNGRVLKRLLAMLPSLLKKGGKAILLNSHVARELIKIPGVTTKSTPECMLFVIPYP